MFAYLISEVLCNIYQVFISRSEESCFSGLTATFESREVSLESTFRAPGQKNIYSVFILKSTSKMSLFISLHDSFT